jgi:NAD/NADP transhydrogenase beta subunit
VLVRVHAVKDAAPRKAERHAKLPHRDVRLPGAREAEAAGGEPGQAPWRHPVAEAEEAAQSVTEAAVLGMEPDDYEMIQQARWRIDEVNQHLAQRGSPVQYAVVLLTITPRPGTAPGEILEGG